MTSFELMRGFSTTNTSANQFANQMVRLGDDWLVLAAFAIWAASLCPDTKPRQGISMSEVEDRVASASGRLAVQRDFERTSECASANQSTPEVKAPNDTSTN